MNEKKLLESLKDRYPDSLPCWEEYLEDEEILTIVALSHFADFVIDLIHKDKLNKAQEIFDYMESVLQKDDQNIREAVTTGFLEQLDNVALEDERVKKALSLLGDECKAYLKAWDDFWKGKK